MNRPLRFAIIMSTEVGLRTHYLNWRSHFPTDLGIEPHWIVVDYWKEGGRLERLPLPTGVKSRLRAQIEIDEGLSQGPFDATLIGVHSALASRANYLRKNPCYMTFDVTPKQLHDFGDFYGKYPSRISAIEDMKHRRRAVSYRECRLLFPWSRWACESAVADYGASADRMRIVPPGVDLGVWSPEGKNVKAGKRICDILFVGGDFERKGGHMLLEWARSTSAKGWRLHIVTRDDIHSSDERITIYHNLSSNDPELIKLYHHADVFALPTLADCYSIAGIEAMAAGLPCIISAVGGTTDVIRDGQTGYLVPLRDGRVFGEKLDELIADPRKRRAMGEAARIDAEVRYDASKNIRKILIAIKESL
ncbi:MAG: glycosyltransferase family 4 protein [Capsulimonadaceae bacterium]|nr:glycosyltransferase family 4 protein [Capsulimonadaceae bacterium]